MRILAAGAGWRAVDLMCSAGPGDPTFEESRDYVSIGLVLDGTFRYRCPQGEATMTPGGVLLGNHQTCFACGHEHSTGDHCVAFHFQPETFEEVVASTPGLETLTFRYASLPPLKSTARLFADIDWARREPDSLSLEELAFHAASRVAAIAADVGYSTTTPRIQDRRRISEAIRRIDDNSSRRSNLETQAREAGMSRYHFLRTFKKIAGVTPHQYILRRRMHKAAIRLRETDLSVLAIALAEGFNDLSTFNRQFRRLMGLTPTAYRAGR